MPKPKQKSKGRSKSRSRSRSRSRPKPKTKVKTAAQKEKVHEVMHEFKHHELMSHDKPVENRDLVAISLSEAHKIDY